MTHPRNEHFVPHDADNLEHGIIDVDEGQVTGEKGSSILHASFLLWAPVHQPKDRMERKAGARSAAPCPFACGTCFTHAG